VLVFTCLRAVLVALQKVCVQTCKILASEPTVASLALRIVF